MWTIVNFYFYADNLKVSTITIGNTIVLSIPLRYILGTIGKFL